MGDISNQLRILIEVQGVEAQILQANRKIGSLADEAAALDRELTEHEKQVAVARQSLDDRKRSYRVFELEAKAVADQIVKSNEKLRVVKTNKEYQSILKEIEDVRKKKAEIEDRMLELLEEIESADALVKEKNNQLSTFSEDCREKKTVLAEKERIEKKAVDALIEKKRQVEGRADPDNIALMADVSKKVRGQAIVPVQGAVCMGCHMNLPPQLFNELQRFDQLRFCPHCHRIIYWKGNA